MEKILNLHTNTEYSFLESTITIDKIFEYAKEHNLNTLSITDHNNMYGVPRFLQECKKNNIKPIIGIDLDVEDYRFIILAKNYQGFIFISKLSSKKMANQTILIKEIFNENVIVIDHPRLGLYAQKQINLKEKDFYVVANDPEIDNAIFVQENRIMTNDENESLKIINAISTNEINEFYFEEFSIYKEIDPIIAQRTNDLEKQINLTFEIKKNPLPKFKNEQNLSSNEYLRKIIKQALIDKEFELKKFPTTLERIKLELEIIENLGFADYFLIIWDLIKWSKEQGIFIGPGRGSSAGSLISYLLNITEVNPLKFDLIFERFLNPKRVSMPDIDIDIQDSRREEVLKYLQNKYGIDNVALIITFQTLGAKMAFRDVSRVFKIPLTTVNEISKLIPSDLNLKETFTKSAIFRAKITNDNILEQVYNIASKIEGLPRQHGTHAAGVVISEENINNLIPTIKLDNGFLQTQFSMEFLEDFGLLKIDLLGLKNLSIIKEVLETVNQRNQMNLQIENLPIYDEKTNRLLSKGKTIGIFQLESPGMISTLKKVVVSKLEDVVDVISLFRPGPMQNIPLYVNRKHKIDLNWEKISPVYDSIVESTYGIIIYQEQIMEIAQKIANMSFADADLLRRAISKKDFSEFSNIKTKFVLGAKKNGYSLEKIENILEQIEKFAEYGFNKSHAVAYGILAYKMAYLKTQFPLDFYSALITNANGVHLTIEKYVIEALSLGFQVEKPNINESENICISDGKRKIILPFIMIKGLGKVATNKLLEVRKQGEFKNFIDFIIRMKQINFSEALIKILIDASTLSEFGNQATLSSNLHNALLYAESVLVKDLEGNLHYDPTILDFDFKLNIVDSNSKEEQENELKLLGLNLSFKRNDKYEGNIKLDDMHNGTQHYLALHVDKIYVFNDKRGREMAKITLSDSSKKILVMIFSSKWEHFKALKENNLYYFNVTRKDNEYFINQNWKEIRDEK